MNLENQVVSLELAKKLKDIGINQESLLSWIKRTDNTWVATSYYGCNCWVTPRGNLDGFNHEECAAFTASEISEMLPCSINSWGLSIDATSTLSNNGIKSLWHCTYSDDNKKLMNELSDLKLSDCLAKMLIYLIDSGFIKVK